jgi:hypothetical protein
MSRNIIYLLIFLVLSCTKNETKKEQAIKNTIVNSEKKTPEIKPETIKEFEKNDSIFIYSTNFKFKNLEKFNLQNWYSGKMEKELKPLTKEKLLQYFQNERINGENIYPTNFRYFSIQKNSIKEKIITIIESDESCCSELHYLIYNEKNELISDNIIAGTGGDGMWNYDKYGKFINDSTYVLTKVEFEELELENEKTEIKIDSVITNYRFNKNKLFEKIKERKFNKKIEK